MRGNSKDRTIVRNYIEKYRFLIREYELVRSGKRPRFRFAEEFYRAHDTDRHDVTRTRRHRDSWF